MYIYTREEPKANTPFTGYMVDEASTIKTFDHASIHRSQAFTEAMNYFDIEDDMTRNILLAVNEADQNTVLASLSNKLYEHIKDKVDDIDFGTIPLSKGDITQIDNYERLTDCINILTEIMQEYHQPTDAIETISLAVQNLEDRKEMFTKAYRIGVEMPIIIYNTIALAIVSATSYMIATCIEFVKLPDGQGFDIALDKAAVNKSKDALLFKDLSRFNKICDNGDFDKSMDYVMKMNANNFAGAGFTFGVATVAGMFSILLIIIPVIRELIFFFYYSRSKAAEYFDAQSSLLMINSFNIQNNLASDPKQKKEIANKQKKVADLFKKISNTLKVNTKTGESKTAKEIKDLDSKKYKHDEVLDNIPDSANSVLF